ncbi:AMP-dependent synthetase/ligase [Ruegeria profundi]|uniref:AMP-dependent synthetase/ligase n=1 Tax=Ruegeria profundi TaxID=1685378 RepID=UPI001CD75052|nr:long-chain fatty acid--CoA ligase [Ruegeria profundi]MCA0927929.1 long-chain fatty acid--CoA ligase [Ruegeria profundi]
MNEIDLNHGGFEHQLGRSAMLERSPTSGVGDALCQTIPEAFEARVSDTPDSPAYIQFVNGAWQTLTWRMVKERVDKRRAAFAQTGLRSGDRIGIFLPNGVEWIVTDLAAMSERLVTVPVYTRDSAANICHVLNDSGAALCVTDSIDRWEGLGPDRKSLTELSHVWLLNGEQPSRGRAIACPDPAKGRHQQDPGEFGSPNDLATLIYTSGTTGAPKGVMLAHKALLWNAATVGKINPISNKDLFLSVLPLAHAFERTLGYICPMLANSPVAFTRSIQELAQDMETLHPTVMLAVPRLFERFHDKVISEAEGSLISRKLLAWTEAIGWHRRQVIEKNLPPPSTMAKLYWSLIGKRVARRVHAAFGGQIRMLICGGAHLSADTSRFFAAMEIPLLQGYGLTEAGPAVTGSTIEDRRCDSVGFTLPGSELRIGDRQELLVRSPSAMIGYWNNPDATNDAFDQDHWLRTGDAAEIIDERVYINGRIKDILVLSTGENVNPTPIETALAANPLVDQVCVLGDGKPWCSAVVVVNVPKFQAWCRGLDISLADPMPEQVRRKLVKFLAIGLEDIPPFARIRDIVIETEPWGLESGLITPTLKPKRPQILARYERAFTKLYR